MRNDFLPVIYSAWRSSFLAESSEGNSLSFLAALQTTLFRASTAFVVFPLAIRQY